MDLSGLEDFSDIATNEIAKFKFEVCLSPQRLREAEFDVASLTWSSVPYGKSQIDSVPNDRRGVYAFVISHDNGLFPPNHSVMYIGIAGRRSGRSLRARYKDYLNPNAILKKRPKIARLIGTWHPVLFFYFAEIDDVVDSDALENLEKVLNGALMPPFSQGDLQVDLKQKRSAF